MSHLAPNDPELFWSRICCFALGVALFPSPSHGVPVAAGVGAAHQGSALEVHKDPLSPAHDPRPLRQVADGVPARRERGPDLGRDTRLGIHGAIPVHADPRRLDGRLNVHVIFEEVEQHLGRRLGDAVAAGRSDGDQETAISEDLGRRHSGLDLPVRRQNVRAPRIQVVPHQQVVEQDTRAACDEAGAKQAPHRLCD